MEPNFGKRYGRHLLLALLGAIPLVLIWHVENRWIALPVGLLSILFILAQLHLVQKVADDQLAYQRQKESDTHYMQPAEEPTSPLKQKLVYYTLLGLFWLCLLALTPTGKKVENLVDWQPLLLDVLKLSLLVFALTWLYHKRFQVVFDDKEKRDYVQLYLFLVPLLLLFHAIVWYNHLQPSAVLARKAVAVDRKSTNARYGTRYLFVLLNEEKKRFEIPKKLHEQIRPHDMVLITIKAGALGYAYIDRFELRPAATP